MWGLYMYMWGLYMYMWGLSMYTVNMEIFDDQFFADLNFGQV